MSYKMERKGKKAIITIEFYPEDTGVLSKSGKTFVLDSSHGYLWEGNIGINYNIVRKRKGKEII